MDKLKVNEVNKFTVTVSKVPITTEMTPYLPGPIVNEDLLKWGNPDSMDPHVVKWGARINVLNLYDVDHPHIVEKGIQLGEARGIQLGRAEGEAKGRAEGQGEALHAFRCA